MLKYNTHLASLMTACLLLAFSLWDARQTSHAQIASEVSVASKETVANLIDGDRQFRAIETLQVGDRVLTGFSSHYDGKTEVNPRTWKRVTIIAECLHSRNKDVFHIESLQPPEWLSEHSVSIGSSVPVPLEVQEMGCPNELEGVVVKMQSCPEIANAPGRVILTTVNHENSVCRQLVVTNSLDQRSIINTTDYHPFWSETKQGWVQAKQLAIGDRLNGVDDQLTVVESNRIPGTHLVFNLAIENDHVYRVGQCSVLVHNNGCSPSPKKKPGPVIGGNMKDRVIPHAKKTGGLPYRHRGEYTLKKNKRWARDKKREIDRGEREPVDDIGPDPKIGPTEAYIEEKKIFFPDGDR